MAKTFPLAVVISAVDKATAPLRKVTSEVSAMGKKLSDVGKSLTATVTAPLSALGGFAIKTGLDFDRGFQRIRAVTGASSDEMRALNAAVRALPPDLGMSRGLEVLEGLVEEGASAADALRMLVPVTQLSRAANLQGAEAAGLVSDTLAAVGGEAGDAQELVDLLTRATGGSSKAMKEYAQILQAAGPGMRASGMALRDQIAAISGLATVNMEGAAGTTALKAAIQALQSPSAAAVQAFTRLGIAQQDVFDQEGNIRPLDGLLKRMSQSGATAADYMEVFGRKTGLAFANIDPTAIERARAALDDVGGATGQRAAQMGEGAAGAWDRFTNSITALMVAISDSGLLAVFADLINLVTPLVSLFRVLSPQTQKTIVIFGALAAAVGPVLVVIGSLISAVTTIGTLASTVGPVLVGVLVAIKAAVVGFGAALMATPIGWIIAGVVALAAAIYLLWDNWDDVTAFMRVAWLWMMQPVRDGILWLQKMLPSLGDLIPDWMKDLIGLPTGAAAGTAAAGAPAGAGASTLAAAATSGVVKSEASVAVTFENLPPGARVEPRRNDGVDLDLLQGYALGS